MNISCSSAEAAPMMGYPGPAINFGHLFSVLLGIAAKHFGIDQTGSERALDKAFHLALSDQLAETGSRCAEACASSCKVCEVTPSIHHHNWKFSISICLFSITVASWLVALCLLRGCCKPRERRVPFTAGDSSPESLDHRRHIAHLQLAEVRARGKRHESGQ